MGCLPAMQGSCPRPTLPPGHGRLVGASSGGSCPFKSVETEECLEKQEPLCT